MTNSRISQIKKEQKESLLFKEISDLFLKTTIDDKSLSGLFLTRVSLSQDKGFCTIYFYSTQGKDYFQSVFETLKLYKPSLRKALSQKIKGRYVPELKFAFDDQFEKTQKVEELFEKLKRDGQL
jgi:ribosome-binding factor A